MNTPATHRTTHTHTHTRTTHNATLPLRLGFEANEATELQVRTLIPVFFVIQT